MEVLWSFITQHVVVIDNWDNNDSQYYEEIYEHIMPLMARSMLYATIFVPKTYIKMLGIQQMIKNISEWLFDMTTETFQIFPKFKVLCYLLNILGFYVS